MESSRGCEASGSPQCFPPTGSHTPEAGRESSGHISTHWPVTESTSWVKPQSSSVRPPAAGSAGGGGGELVSVTTTLYACLMNCLSALSEIQAYPPSPQSL